MLRHSSHQGCGSNVIHNNGPETLVGVLRCRKKSFFGGHVSGPEGMLMCGSSPLRLRRCHRVRSSCYTSRSQSKHMSITFMESSQSNIGLAPSNNLQTKGWLSRWPACRFFLCVFFLGGWTVHCSRGKVFHVFSPERLPILDVFRRCKQKQTRSQWSWRTSPIFQHPEKTTYQAATYHDQGANFDGNFRSMTPWPFNAQFLPGRLESNPKRRHRNILQGKRRRAKAKGPRIGDANVKHIITYQRCTTPFLGRNLSWPGW